VVITQSSPNRHAATLRKSESDFRKPAIVSFAIAGFAQKTRVLRVASSLQSLTPR
jgi:molecular chaperone GrpE (heat shock protein)